MDLAFFSSTKANSLSKQNLNSNGQFQTFLFSYSDGLNGNFTSQKIICDSCRGNCISDIFRSIKRLPTFARLAVTLNIPPTRKTSIKATSPPHLTSPFSTVDISKYAVAGTAISLQPLTWGRPRGVHL